MFFGTTPSPVRAFMEKWFLEHPPKRVVEPCAGNFVVSQLSGALFPKLPVLSGDVSVYSCALGAAFTGEDAGIRLTAEAEERFPILAGKTDPKDVGAAVLLLSEVAMAMRKDHIGFYQRQLEDFERNGQAYWEKARGQIDKVSETMSESFVYRGQDAVVTCSDVGPGDVVFFDPPHYKGDYEKMYEALRGMLTWEQEPSYTEFDADGRDALIQQMVEKGAQVFTRPEFEIDLPGFELVFRFEYTHGREYLLYTNKRTLIAQGHAITLRDEDPKLETLWYDTSIGKRTRVAFDPPARGNESNHYRLLWTKKALMKDVGHPFLFTVQGKVAGVLSARSGMEKSTSYTQIIADCVTPHSKYKRLSKLILMCALTHEMMERWNAIFMWPHEHYTTNAYSKKPVSMKYRGLFKLAERQIGAAPTGDDILVYRADPQWDTIEEAKREWIRRYGKELRDGP